MPLRSQLLNSLSLNSNDMMRSSANFGNTRSHLKVGLGDKFDQKLNTMQSGDIKAMRPFAKSFLTRQSDLHDPNSMGNGLASTQ